MSGPDGCEYSTSCLIQRCPLRRIEEWYARVRTSEWMDGGDTVSISTLSLLVDEGVISLYDIPSNCENDATR